mmetsp:Transcript_15699/g.23181  ORF Transcript_15699/g.23181 Transcript_15699/m.23181 type:complete len:168 (+) Transcript_15699:445-948(+)
MSIETMVTEESNDFTSNMAPDRENLFLLVVWSSCIGEEVGFDVGIRLGRSLSLADGLKLDEIVGLNVGLRLGKELCLDVGMRLGITLGFGDGARLGKTEGNEDMVIVGELELDVGRVGELTGGVFEGEAVGDLVGEPGDGIVGFFVGIFEGLFVGTRLGITLGRIEG